MRPSRSESPLYEASGRRTRTARMQAKTQRHSVGEADWHLDSETASGYEPGNTANLNLTPQLRNLDFGNLL